MHPAMSAVHSAALLGERMREAEQARQVALADRDDRPVAPSRVRRFARRWEDRR